jgi:hypothetical protein
MPYMGGVRRWVRLLTVTLLLGHLAGVPSVLAEQPCREVARVPARPKSLSRREPPHLVFADRSGYLYCQVDAKAYAMAVDQGTGVWIELPFEGPVELGGNAGGGVFACLKEGGSSVFCRMNGLKAERIVGHSTYDLGAWYVDGVGRVWLQTLEEDGRGLKDLVVLQEGNDARVIQSRPSVYATRIRRPCEYKPGHVVLFFKTSMIWATPTEIDVREPPRFASDGTGQGPLPLGEHFLVSGGGNNIGIGSYLIDTCHPDEPARRLALGWDWFWPVASAPDGRALVIAQTDRNPRYTLFWYAPDGNSQVRLEGADDVLRAGLLDSVHHYSPRGGILCFDSGNNGYAALQDGVLAVFEADRARLLTPADGLPLEKVVDIAMLGDRLAMVDADGRVVLWHTRVPLEQTAEDDFARRRRWRLAGPCAIGADGNLWAFLAAFPGQISRFDGRQWWTTPNAPQEGY